MVSATDPIAATTPSASDGRWSRSSSERDPAFRHTCQRTPADEASDPCQGRQGGHRHVDQDAAGLAGERALDEPRQTGVHLAGELVARVGLSRRRRAASVQPSPLSSLSGPASAPSRMPVPSAATSKRSVTSILPTGEWVSNANATS